MVGWCPTQCQQMEKDWQECGAVNYGDLDPFKVAAQGAAASTAGNLGEFGLSEVGASRGESAYVWDDGEETPKQTPEELALEQQRRFAQMRQRLLNQDARVD